MKLDQKKILVTGANGFLGRHVVASLVERKGLSAAQVIAPSSTECDLTRRENCERAVRGCDLVIHLAGCVGGIGFNESYPGEMLYSNLVMGVELIEAARKEGVEKVVIIGTTCSYPKICEVPFKEEDLWSGYPDEITGPYGLAKKMLLVQGQAYKKQYGFKSVFLIPTNLYGPGDHFHGENTHVIPALIRRFVDATNSEAKRVVVWGTGKATREFLYVADAADGIILAAERYDEALPTNLGTGVETPIAELVRRIADLCGFDGEIVWDDSRPDGQPRRSLDVSHAYERFGFLANTQLANGLDATVRWYIDQRNERG